VPFVLGQLRGTLINLDQMFYLILRLRLASNSSLSGMWGLGREGEPHEGGWVACGTHTKEGAPLRCFLVECRSLSKGGTPPSGEWGPSALTLSH
jgi:hypothetical protein